jgi:hypothetical protein
MLLPACFTIPDYDGPLGPAASDEDGDGIPNAQDQCPIVNAAGAPQVDSDNDGLGNACDPNPGLQDVHVFYGFDSYSIEDLSTTGRIEPSDSFVEIGITGTDAYNGVTSERTLSKTQVDIRFQVVESMDTVDGGLGVRLGRYGPSDDDAAFCKIDLEPPDRLQLTASYKSSITTRSMMTLTDEPFALTTGHLRGTLAGMELTCLIDQLSPEHAPISISVLLTTPPDPAAPGTAGAYARNSRMNVEYLFITGLP